MSIESCRRVSALFCALVFALSSATCADVALDGPSPTINPDAPPARTATGAMVYDQDPGFCDDTDGSGDPYTPARPVWSDLVGVHYDGITQADGTASQRIPDYQNISYNLAILQSLQFLLSTVSNITNKVEDAQSFIEDEEYLDALYGAIPQVDGHCVCLTGGCDPATLLDEVDQTIENLVAIGDVQGVLEGYLTEKVDATIADFEDLLAYFQDLIDPTSGFTADLQSTIEQAVIDQINDAQANMIDPLQTACDPGVLDPTVLATAVETAVTANVAELRMEVENDYQTVRDAIDLVVTLPSSVLQQLKTDIEILLAYFDGVEGIDDLIDVDWANFVDTVNGMVPFYTQVVDDVQAAIDDVTGVWNNVANFDQRIEDLAQDTYDDIVAELQAYGGDVQACIDALNNAGNYLAGFSPQDFIDALFDDIEALILAQWDEIRTRIQETYDSLTERITGIGLEDALSVYTNELLSLNGFVSAALQDCYDRGTRPECFDFCGATGATAQNDFIWLPVDFLQDPAAAGAGAASAGLFVLEQTGWLDQITEWVQTQMESELGAAFQTILGFLGDFAQTIQNIIDFLGNAFEYIDRFTEGYHLGSYTDLRPDLHQCVPWLGHGAYARIGGGSGDGAFSIGARYGAHQLSRSNRVQVRTGGFAVEAFGYNLTIVPNLSLNLQMDGWKLWDQTRPFGIPLNVTMNAETIGRYDVFNVVPMDNYPFGFTENVPLGATLVRDLYPSRPSGGATPDWPRPGVDAPWEGRAIAATTLGLNLHFDYPADEPETIDLPSIPVIPGILTATPSFSYQIGAGWEHETNLMRDRVQESINANLPSAQQLDSSDFERDMHALQAPDLTDDNRVFAYAEPGIGIEAFLGFKIFKIRIGAGANVNLSVNIEAGATGGVLDVNAALADSLVNMNPPQDAPCEPIWDFSTDYACSNEDFPESAETYSCVPEDGQGYCCIQVVVLQSDNPPAYYGACIDGWTGMDRDNCGKLEFSGDSLDEINSFLNNIPDFLGSLKTQLLNVTSLASAVEVQSSWSDEGGCSTATCSENPEVETLLDTGVANVSGLAECDQFGFCTTGDLITHDVTLNACEGQGGLDGIWTSYACRGETSAEVVGWQGDGCHPLQQGFPSACGCATDADCAAGETCGTGGQCTDGTPSFSCVCTSGGGCPAGRTCVDGGCATLCAIDDDCAAGRVCDAGACVPPEGIPTAESIVWGMDNVEAPMHLISSYAMSDILATLMLTLDLYVEASFKLFGKERKWRILDFHRGWDLGSTWKGWYQPGLEAFYQDECEDPALASLVTNRFPQSTANGPTAPQISGVSPNALCLNGGVCRYPANLPASQASPEDYVTGNAGDVADLITYCRETIPENVEDPDPSTNGGIIDAATDTYEFSQDVTVAVYTNNPICVDGVQWDQWMAGLGPEFDDDGNIVDDGNLVDYDCRYDDPVTGTTWIFPCTDINAQMMAIWGCLDVDANIWAQQLAANAPSTVINTVDFGDIFDLSAIFIPQLSFDTTYGLGEENEYTVSSMLPSILTLSNIPYFNIGYQWLITVDACVDARFNDPAETVCECDTSSDCFEGEQCSGGICEFQDVFDDTGACINPDCSPVWTPSLCSPVALQADIGPCCGDGQIQEGEECDDGVDGSATCTPDCTLITGIAEGACCMGPGQCVEPLSGDDCRAQGGSAFPTTTCDALDYCGDGSPPPSEPTGGCCTGVACIDDLTFDECGELGGFWEEDKPCNGFPDCPVIGACCTVDAGCFNDVPQHECPSSATFSPDLMCSAVTCPTNLGACCESDGTCTDAVEEGDCTGSSATWNANSTCASGVCGDPPTPLGACCNQDGTCDDNTTALACLTSGGSWSYNQSCADVGCGDPPPPTGACCETDGTCTEGTTALLCLRSGGTFNEGDLCADVGCGDPPPRLGACCETDGSCTEGVPELLCDRSEGTWNPDLMCSEVSCGDPPPPRRGACCETNGTCTENTTALLCLRSGGTFNGDLMCSEVDCPQPPPPVGACCQADGVCTNGLTIVECRRRDGHWNEGEVCESGICDELPPIGACCERDGVCTDGLTDLDCRRRGGSWAVGLTCESGICDDPPVVGACCLPEGGCLEGVNALDCRRRGGDWSARTPCSEALCTEPVPTGACCQRDGTCNSYTTFSECRDVAGRWTRGLTCDEVPCGDIPCENDPLFGTRCGECGTYSCNVEGELFCDEPRNECGGCSTLRGRVGDACDECGTLQCSGPDALECVSPVGGCGDEVVGSCCTTRGVCEDGQRREACQRSGGSWSRLSCEVVGRFCGGFCDYRPNVELGLESSGVGRTIAECGVPKVFPFINYGVWCTNFKVTNLTDQPIFGLFVELLNGTELFQPYGRAYLEQVDVQALPEVEGRPSDALGVIEVGDLEPGQSTEVRILLRAPEGPYSFNGRFKGVCQDTGPGLGLPLIDL